MDTLILQLIVVCALGLSWLLKTGLNSIKTTEQYDEHEKRRQTEWSNTQATKDHNSFNYERAHHLVMSRKMLDKLNNDPQATPMDTYHFLDEWKLRVAEYIEEYGAYLQNEKKSTDAKVTSLRIIK